MTHQLQGAQAERPHHAIASLMWSLLLPLHFVLFITSFIQCMRHDTPFGASWFGLMLVTLGAGVLSNHSVDHLFEFATRSMIHKTQQEREAARAQVALLLYPAIALVTYLVYQGLG